MIIKRPPPTSPQLVFANSMVIPDLGPIDSYFTDPTVTEIMVNDLRNISIERNGKLEVTPDRFESLKELNRVVELLLRPFGKTITEENPSAMVSLSDGSRVHAIGPPLTQVGPCITIRRFPKRFSLEELAHAKMLDADVLSYLTQAVQQKKSILICGGTGTGKTTLLNALISYFPMHERIVALEDSAELQLLHPNHVKLMTRPKTQTTPAITIGNLLYEALRMRPDRLVVGEVRGPEALDLLQAMITGHPGSMTTVHSNTPREGLHRMETLVMMNALDMTTQAVRRQVGSAIDVIVQIQRGADGSRFISEITEITGVGPENYILHWVFRRGGPNDAYEYTPSAKGIEIE
jgi:pilus assembly protein CpaF